jgi:hypothetical protein
VRAYKGWLKGQPYLRIYRGGGESLLSTIASNVGLNSFLPSWAEIEPKPSVVGHCEFGSNKLTLINLKGSFMHGAR